MEPLKALRHYQKFKDNQSFQDLREYFSDRISYAASHFNGELRKDLTQEAHLAFVRTLLAYRGTDKEELGLIVQREIDSAVKKHARQSKASAHRNAVLAADQLEIQFDNTAVTRLEDQNELEYLRTRYAAAMQSRLLTELEKSVLIRAFQALPLTASQKEALRRAKAKLSNLKGV